MESSAWEKHGNAALEAESNLGMTENSDVGNYGYDVLGIGRPGNGNVTLTKLQVVATVATKDFFVGSVGLAARRVSTAEMGQPPGLLASLNDEKLIPSLSYGYTAGAAYRKTSDAPITSRLTLSREEQCELDLRRVRSLQVYTKRHQFPPGVARDARVGRRIAIDYIDGSERE